MRAIVLVKSVPLGSIPLKVVGNRLSRDGQVHGLDVINEPPLEWALRHRSSGELSEVVALTMGPTDAQAALRSALTFGCDRAVHVVDDRLARADVRRTIGVLASAIAKAHGELALFGHESADGSSGTVPAGVASALGWPLLSRTSDASLHRGVVAAHRDLGSVAELLEARAPAVLSFVSGEIVARNTTLKDAITARRKPIEILAVDALGGDPADDVPVETVIGLRVIDERPTERLVLEPANGVDRLAALLRGA